MKKFVPALSIVALLFGLIQPQISFASEKPTIVSFKMSPESVDVTATNPLVTFELIAKNPSGIYSQTTKVTLTDGLSNSLSALMTRIDNPVNPKLDTVTFKGSLTVPANIPTGVYTATAQAITALNEDGSVGYSTDTLIPTSNSKVVGAENALLIRSGGDLNFNYATFKGPAYNKTLGIVFKNPKYNSISDPIWKVGETFDPNDYFELNVPSLVLKIKSSTESVCTSNGSELTIKLEGGCAFTIYTDKTSDYQNYSYSQSVNITSARVKPTLVVGTIPTQSSAKLPLTIQGPYVMGPFGIVIPKSATPAICYATDFYITVISGGTCTLNYTTPASAEYLASDINALTFEITRNAQSVTFALPGNAPLASKTLALTGKSSSGLPISYSTSTANTCAVNGNVLTFLKPGNCSVTATQLGSTTIAPSSVTQSVSITGALVTLKKLICVKNGKIKVVLSKKCPTGYKPKK